MKKASLVNDLQYDENKPAVQVLFDTESSKEIRIAMRKGHVMKEHKTPYPIVVEIFEGHIRFGIKGESNELKKGDLVFLEGNVPHDLEALQDSTIRLTLTKADTAERVKGVAEKS
ncbi:cupin [Salinimicrobium marinum]|uniref:Cupin n=1 Tax=Salinimicrobium marinum TaxID=680283 RepID=A0A918SGM8_9FLAO|nr:cupin domain-containing protein [Salinimicrobium marinum]GHA37780.1 cupin [Salinimicrobium marinum]